MKIKSLITLIFAFSLTQNYGSESQDQILNEVIFPAASIQPIDILLCRKKMQESFNMKDIETFKICLETISTWIKCIDKSEHVSIKSIFINWLTLINYYIFVGDVEQLKSNLNYPKDKKFDWTPLMWATASNNIKIIKFLIKEFRLDENVQELTEAYELAKLLNNEESSKILDCYLTISKA